MATEYEGAPSTMESIAEVHVHDLPESDPSGGAGESSSRRPSSRKKYGQIEIIFHQDHRIDCGSTSSEDENENEEILKENKTLYALVEKLQASYDKEKSLTTNLTQELESCKSATENEDTEHKIKVSELNQNISENENIITALQGKIKDLLTNEKRESQVHDSQVHDIKNQHTKEIQELLKQLEEAKLNENLIKSQMCNLENKYVNQFKDEMKELHDKIEEKEKIINALQEDLKQVSTERDSALQRTLQLEDALRESCAELRDKLWLSTEAFDDVNKKSDTLETELENQRAVNENQRGSIELLNVELHSATEKARASECEIVQLQDRSKSREQDLLTEITELKQECSKYIEQLELSRREVQELREISTKVQESIATQNSVITDELNAKISELKKGNKALTEELKDMIQDQNNSQQQNLKSQAEISELKEKCNEKENMLSKLAINAQNKIGSKYREWIADRKSSKLDGEESEINDLKLKLKETENSLLGMKNELSLYKAKYDENKKKLENYRNELKEKDQDLQEKSIENVGLKLELDSYRQNKPVSYRATSEKRVASVKSTKSRRNSSRVDCYSSCNSQSSLVTTRRHIQSSRRRLMRHHGSDFDSSAGESVIQEHTKVTTVYRSPEDIFPLSVCFFKQERGVMRVVVNNSVTKLNGDS